MVSDNDRGVQRLYINEALTKSLLKDPNAKEFIGEKLRNAQWLIRAIEQRRKTIIRVTECNRRKAARLFRKGRRIFEAHDFARRCRRGRHARIDHQPRHHQQIRAHAARPVRAEILSSTPAIRRTSEEDIASESVKQAIKKIIEDEDKQSILSATKPSSKSSQKPAGIQIARRTVAKYREMLGILGLEQTEEGLLEKMFFAEQTLARRRFKKHARVIECSINPRIGVALFITSAEEDSGPMQISITFRQMESMDSLKTVANEKIGRLAAFFAQSTKSSGHAELPASRANV